MRNVIRHGRNSSPLFHRVPERDNGTKVVKVQCPNSERFDLLSDCVFESQSANHAYGASYIGTICEGGKFVDITVL